MAEGDIGAVLGTLEFDIDNGEVPKLVHIDGIVYAIAYRGPDVHGWIKTVTISADGATIAFAGGSLEFDAAAGDMVDIIHVTGSVYAVAYRGVDGDGFIKAVTISADGTAIALAGGSLEFDEGWCADPNIIHIANEVYAIAYTGSLNSGWIKAVTISADGATIALAGGGLEFDIGIGFYPGIVYVSGIVYAIAYYGADGDGWIKTITINNTGTTIDFVGGSLEFDEDFSRWADIILIANDVYAIAYAGPDTDGWIKTVTISADGATLALAGGWLEFDDFRGDTPDIVRVSGSVYAIAYQGGIDEGWIKTFTISTDGATIIATGQSLEFDDDTCQTPDLIYITGNVYAIAYGGPGADGFIKTVEIETVQPSNGRHELIMGLG